MYNSADSVQQAGATTDDGGLPILPEKSSPKQERQTTTTQEKNDHEKKPPINLEAPITDLMAVISQSQVTTSTVVDTVDHSSPKNARRAAAGSLSLPRQTTPLHSRPVPISLCSIYFRCCSRAHHSHSVSSWNLHDGDSNSRA